MTRVMYDAVDVGQIPADAGAVAGYVDGHFPTFRKLSRFKANRLSITVTASNDAACLDVEPGDATPELAAGWVRRQLDRGQYRPVIYASRDTMPAIIHALQAAGIDRSRVRLWSAHWGIGPHICSSVACGASFTADGTQFTDKALGRSLDESLLVDDFFPAAPKRKPVPVPKPKPPHPKVAGATAGAALGAAISAVLHAAGVHITPAEANAISALGALVAGTVTPSKKATS